MGKLGGLLSIVAGAATELQSFNPLGASRLVESQILAGAATALARGGWAVGTVMLTSTNVASLSPTLPKLAKLGKVFCSPSAFQF